MGLLWLISTFLAQGGMTETRFGREAVNDPRFVRDLRRGRTPRPLTEARVRRFIADREVAR